MPHLQAPVGPSPLASSISAASPGQTPRTQTSSPIGADGVSFTATLARLDGGDAKLTTLPAGVQAPPSPASQVISPNATASEIPDKAASLAAATQPTGRTHRLSGRMDQAPAATPETSISAAAPEFPVPAPTLMLALPPAPTMPTTSGTTNVAPSGNDPLTETSATPPSHPVPPENPAQVTSLAENTNPANLAQHASPVAELPSIGVQPAAAPPLQTVTSTLALACPGGIAGNVTPSPSIQSAPASTTSAPVNDQIAPILLRIATSGGSHQVTLHLTPDTLGRVTIEIDQPKDGPVSVTLSAERPETLALLKRDEAQLGQTLDRAGVPSDNRVVSFHLAPAPAAASNQDSTSQGGSSQGNPAQPSFGQSGFGSNGGGSDDARRPPTPHAAYTAVPDPDADWNTFPVTAASATASRAGLNITA